MSDRLFIKGVINKGVQEQKAKDIYKLYSSSREVFFSKAHAVAFATFSYQTAYLKANYPKEYIAA